MSTNDLGSSFRNIIKYPSTGYVSTQTLQGLCCHCGPCQWHDRNGQSQPAEKALKGQTSEDLQFHGLFSHLPWRPCTNPVVIRGLAGFDGGFKSPVKRHLLIYQQHTSRKSSVPCRYCWQKNGRSKVVHQPLVHLSSDNAISRTIGQVGSDLEFRNTDMRLS